MMFELMSQNINTSAVELDFLKNQGMGEAAKIFQAYLGGAMVQEYDAQIQAFTAELTAMNSEKAMLRTDKLAITELQASGKTITAADQYYIHSVESNQLPYEGEAVILAWDEVLSLTEQAASLGVEIDAGALPVGPKGDFAVSSDFLKSMEQALDDKLTALNSTSELKAIQFQSLMDARKQAMIMLSNLINSSHETKMAILQNLKG